MQGLTSTHLTASWHAFITVLQWLTRANLWLDAISLLPWNWYLPMAAVRRCSSASASLPSGTSGANTARLELPAAPSACQNHTTTPGTLMAQQHELAAKCHLENKHRGSSFPCGKKSRVMIVQNRTAMIPHCPQTSSPGKPLHKQGSDGRPSLPCLATDVIQGMPPQPQELLPAAARPHPICRSQY